MKNSKIQLMRSLFLLTVFFIIFPSRLFCQEEGEYSIFNYSVDKGLSQSTVFSICQDAQGFIWIGTRGGGLNRFDGYEFRIYRSSHHDPFSISGNEVIALYEDRGGKLWVGNRFSGVDRFDKDKEQFIHYDYLHNRDELFSVNCFREDSSGKLWMGSDIGLFFYDNRCDSFKLVSINRAYQVSSILEYSDSCLVLGSRQGILLYNKKKSTISCKFEVYYEGTEKGRQWNPPVLIDSKKNLWHGSLRGLYLVKDLDKGIVIKNPFNYSFLENAHIRSVLEDKNGFIWVGYESGLLRIDPATGKYLNLKHNDNNPESIGHSSVYSLLEDDKGNIWVGTWGGGVSMLSYLPRKFLHYKHIPFSNSLSNNMVSSFAETTNGVWIGTEAGGLNFFDREKKQFSSFRMADNTGIKSDFIKCVLNDSDETLWVGTWGQGLYKLNKKSRNFQAVMENLNVFCLTEDINGFIWVGTLNGLYRIEKQSGKSMFYAPENNSGLKDYFITCLFCDKRGNIWAGTKTGGLHQYNPQKDNFISFTHINDDSTSLIDNYVISINQDAGLNLWIGTNKGLCRFKYQDAAFEDHSGKMNLPDNVINGIVPDGSGNLWLSTNKGLSCYAVESGMIKNFDVFDGLQSNEFNRGSFFKSSNGEIFFGGINGYNCFKPENIRYNQVPPKIVITEIKLFNQQVIPHSNDGILTRHISETKEIKLNYKQSFFEIGFVALNFLNPSKNQYKYKLEGYNQDWVETGNFRKASFMNLKEGDYIFRVTGSNNDGLWNEDGIALKIKVLPPPWKTNLAYIIYISIIFFSLFLLQRFMSFRFEQKNLVKLERLEKERNEQLNKLKLQFFTNITHEFRTPLTLIAGPIDLLVKENIGKEQKSFYYRIIKSNIKRLKQLVDQILEFRKIENEKLTLKVRSGNLHSFLFGLFENFTDFAERKNIDFQFDSDIDTDSEHWFDPDFIDKIIFNLLSNAFKFTGSGGLIRVTAHLDNGTASVSVKDSGNGISEDYLPHVFERFYNHQNPSGMEGTGIGLYLSKHLVEIHKGSIEVRSTLGKGSEFIISIPVKKDSYTYEEIAPVEKSAAIFHEVEKDEISDSDLKPLFPFEKEDYHLDRDTLLVVDDNHEMVACLASFFSGKFIVKTAYNGKDAVSIAREKFPNLIITDLIMPDMDGIELCNKIKSDSLINHIPVIILTAKAGLENQIEGLQSGADAYIEKPFDFVYLETVVDNLLLQREILRKRYSLESTAFDFKSDISPGNKFLTKAFEIIEKNLPNSDFSIEELGQDLNMSRSQLFRKFRSVIGMSPSDFIRIARLKKAALVLLKEDIGINQVAYEVGFTSTSHFITAFKKFYGSTPKHFIASKKGMKQQ